MSRRAQVVIAGRPNVGKSSLLNRIVGRRVAVVEEHPGVTRDRKLVEAEWTGVPFDLIDTGGWMAAGDELDDKVSAQAQKAFEDADVILFVVDASVGVTGDDQTVGRLIARTGRPVLLVANKVDDLVHEASIWELMTLGAGEPFPVSALHGRGTGDLLDALVAALPDDVDTEEGPLKFIDTAGMRRRARTERGAETHSVLRALDSLDRADIALLVVDATVGASHQDQRLAERISVAGCPAVVILNKWDLIETEERESIMAGVGDKLAFLGTAPVIKISAASGQGVHKILPAIFEATDTYGQRVPTGALNRAIRDLQSKHPAPGARIRYAVQGDIEPPTFTLFCSARLPQTYLRYVERSLREAFDFGSTPMKIRVRIG